MASKDGIKVVLLDTPGLAEANKIEVTDVTECALTNCSVYVYVITCAKLQNEFDQKTLRAIIDRDPGKKIAITYSYFNNNVLRFVQRPTSYSSSDFIRHL